MKETVIAIALATPAAGLMIAGTAAHIATQARSSYVRRHAVAVGTAGVLLFVGGGLAACLAVWLLR